VSRMVRASAHILTVVAVLCIAACGSITRSASPQVGPSIALSVGPSVVPSVSDSATVSSSVSEPPPLSVQALAQDTSRLPAAPRIESVTAAEGSLAVRISGPSGPGVISQYIVTAMPEAGGPEITTEWPAMAWAGRYFYVTRERDDSCAPDRICWNLITSRLPNGVQDGMTWSWGGGGQTKGPDPIPLP
jgi:hypothetical protein